MNYIYIYYICILYIYIYIIYTYIIYMYIIMYIFGAALASLYCLWEGGAALH